VLRTLALAQAWTDAGGEAAFAVAAAGESLEARIRQESIRVLRVAAPAGSSADAAETGNLARRLGARWVVLDGYAFRSDFRASLRAFGVPVLAVDDTGEAAPWSGADAILNPNLHAAARLYDTRDPECALMLGPGWAPLRREFLALRGAPRQIPERARKILVTFGGADPAGMAPRAARALSGFDAETRVTVVAGLADTRRRAAGDGRAPEGVEMVERPPDFPARLAESDLVVGAAGSTSWEIAYLGIPFVALATAENQVEIAASLEKAGVARNLGWHAEISEASLRAAVAQLAADAGRRRAMSEAGRALVDGRGAARVVERLATAKAA
jgi:spore coat polysaccharide biosynthesis predicted glycosyltransferase SpsG